MNIRRALQPDAVILRQCLWMAIQSSPTLLAQLGEAQIQRQEDLYWGRWDADIDPGWVAEDLHAGGPRGRRAAPPRSLDCGVGGGLVLKLKENGVYRLGIALFPHARGSGLGARFMTIVQHFARSQRRPLELLVDPENERAIRLYLRSGFQPDGEQQDLIRMRWSPQDGGGSGLS